MKSFILAVVCAMCVTSVVSAKTWKGTQVLTVIAADNVEVNDWLALRGSAHLFWIPGDGTMQYFGYVGPRFNVNDWFWTSPQIGVAGNWSPDGTDAFLASIWNGFTFLNGDLFMLAEGDVFIYDGQIDYYGYYFLDYSQEVKVGRLAIGPQIEHVNTDFIGGVHGTLYTKSGPFFSVQYYLALKGELEQTLRFVLGLFY